MPQPHIARGPEQVGTDLALLKGRHEDAVGRPRSRLRQVGLAQAQRQAAQVVAVERQNIEGVELHDLVMLSRVQAVEVGDAVNTENSSVTRQKSSLQRLRSHITREIAR